MSNEKKKQDKPPRSLPNKDFFDKEFRAKMQQDYDDMRHRRKMIKGKPSPEEVALIHAEHAFERFYKRFL